MLPHTIKWAMQRADTRGGRAGPSGAAAQGGGGAAATAAAKLPGHIVQACKDDALKPVKRWLNNEDGDVEAREEEEDCTMLIIAAA